MLEIMWGFFGLSCGVIGSVMYDGIKLKKRKVKAPQDEMLGVTLGSAIVSRDVDHNTVPKIRISVIEAINGKILEVSTAMPAPNTHSHYDWKTEMYIVPEDQKLSESISTVILMKGLQL